MSDSKILTAEQVDSALDRLNYSEELRASEVKYLVDALTSNDRHLRKLVAELADELVGDEHGLDHHDGDCPVCLLIERAHRIAKGGVEMSDRTNADYVSPFRLGYLVGRADSAAEIAALKKLVSELCNAVPEDKIYGLSELVRRAREAIGK